MPPKRTSKRRSPKAAKPEEEGGVLDEAAVNAMTVAKLKTELEKRGVDKKDLKAKKAVLAERLLELVKADKPAPFPVVEEAAEEPAAEEEKVEEVQEVAAAVVEEATEEAPTEGAMEVEAEETETTEMEVTGEVAEPAEPAEPTEPVVEAEASDTKPEEKKAKKKKKPAHDEKPDVARVDNSTLQGTVKWFDERKGFGFINTISDGGKDVFFHASSINTDADPKVIAAGIEVEFTWKPDEPATPTKGYKKAKKPHKGGRGQNISMRGGGQIIIHDSLRTPEFRKRLAANPEIKLGTCKFFNDKKGYGFIAPLDGTEDIFVHHSDLKMPPGANQHVAEGVFLEYKLSIEEEKKEAAPAKVEEEKSEEKTDENMDDTEELASALTEITDETKDETKEDAKKEEKDAKKTAKKKKKEKKSKKRGIEVTGPGGAFVGWTLPPQGPQNRGTFSPGGRGRGAGRGRGRGAGRGRGRGPMGGGHGVFQQHQQRMHMAHPQMQGRPLARAWPMPHQRPHPMQMQQMMGGRGRGPQPQLSPRYAPQVQHNGQVLLRSPNGQQQRPQQMYPRAAGGLPSYTAGVQGGFNVSPATSAWASIQAQGQQVHGGRGGQQNRKRHGGPMNRGGPQQRPRHM